MLTLKIGSKSIPIEMIAREFGIDMSPETEISLSQPMLGGYLEATAVYDAPEGYPQTDIWVLPDEKTTAPILLSHTEQYPVDGTNVSTSLYNRRYGGDRVARMIHDLRSDAEVRRNPQPSRIIISSVPKVAIEVPPVMDFNDMHPM